MSNYSDLLKAVEQYYGAGSDEWAEIAKYGITSDKAAQILKQVPGVDIWVNANGSVRSYNLKATENIASTAEQAVNSNVPAKIKSFEIPSNSGIETVTSETGETVKQMTFKSGMKQAGNFVFGEVTPAVCAAATGITLGKTVDSLLYNANPDFWDEHGMSTLNPDTWNNITSNDTVGGRLFNMVFGLNPDNKTQAYLDENAFAYLTAYMNQQKIFDAPISVITDEKISSNYPSGLIANSSGVGKASTEYGTIYLNFPTTKYVAFIKDHVIYVFSASTSTFKFGVGTSASTSANNTASVKTIYGKKIYYATATSSIAGTFNNITFNYNTGTPSVNDNDIFYALAYGTFTEKYAVNGIGTQPSAKTPTITGTTPADVLAELKEQYPDLWNNAVTQDVAQPDGSTVTYTYVPVAMPDIDENGNPISSSSTQADPQVDPATDPESLLDVITKIIQRDPPVNPPDTGGGVTPVVPPATGSASSLYAIYNPTLAQINSFGAWLWSDNFVDQIKKLFNDPMQAIIGLHKVYATPATGGAQTIKVGYLDSGVSAKVVSNQYTTIDCGTVRLSEQFHNVFDYSPYTEVNLYLPFIGIVNINVADVMRSSIHIVYHVDVLSGACLAEVKVTRDSAGGTLYQYAGNASVTLPISSGSYMGIVSAVAGVAGGIAGTIASGGSALPLIASSAGAMFNAHTRVEHSGGFSGNAGAMGGKIPYLIISRPQTEMADGFENYIGYPSNFTATIGSCTGFIKVIECHVENTSATKSELEEIDSILKEGVII